MSNSDFEDRLSRIKSAGGQHSTVPSGGPEKTSFLRGIILGAVAVTAGAQLIKVANTNYDSIRDQYGIPAAAGLGLGSIALMVLGVVLFIRAVLPSRGVANGQSSFSHASRAQVQTSAGARLFFSLFGLSLGGLACLFMYVGNAGRQLGVTGQVDAETARAMATGSAVAAILLVALGFLIGFVGLFVRRLPLRRVPVFLILGAMALYTTFQTLRIHPTNWPTFMAEFTKSFTNQTGG